MCGRIAPEMFVGPTKFVAEKLPDYGTLVLKHVGVCTLRVFNSTAFPLQQ
jgi:hypothetical protein